MSLRNGLSVDRKKQIHRMVMRRPVKRLLRRLSIDRGYLVSDRLASRADRQTLERMRGDRDVCWLEGDTDEPIVTVAIPTYNRPATIMRAVESAARQTYERLDILVVGDATDDVTARLVTAYPDDRVRFVNLPQRGRYPVSTKALWQAMGVKPRNAAFDLAAGSWFVACDDDDEMLPHQVEALLLHARAHRLEFVYGKSAVVYETSEVGAVAPRSADVEAVGSAPLRESEIAQGSSLHSMGLGFIRYDVECWRLDEPSDWNLFRRIERAGARIGFLDEVVHRHYLGERPRPAFDAVPGGDAVQVVGP